MIQSPPSSADSSSYIPRGKVRLLRKETVEYDILLRDKFNMALRINYLEDQLRLLKGGEGYTEADVLAELNELRAALKSSEDELRESTLKHIKVVDELRKRLQKENAAPTAAGAQTLRQGDTVEPASPVSYQNMCSTLQERLDDMTQQKQNAIDEAIDTQRQIKHLMVDFEKQGAAMRDLKNDHEKALDAIYELESELLQHKGENKEHIETEPQISEEKVKTLTEESDGRGVAGTHIEQFLTTTIEQHNEGHRQMDGLKLLARSYRDLCSRLKKKLKRVTHERQKQTEKNASLRLDNDMLSQVLNDARKQVDTLQSDLEVASGSICALHDAELQQAKEHELTVQGLEREISNLNQEKQTLDRTWSHRYNVYHIEKERQILKLKGENRYAILKAELVEKELHRERNDFQAHEQKDSHNKDQLKSLEESNRVMFQDLQECYTKCEVIFREKIDLLNATSIYKKAIAERDADIAEYRIKIMQYLRRLQDHCSLNLTNDELAQQLKETKAMIAVALTRLENSPVGAETISTLSVPVRRQLKTIHGDHLTTLNKKLEDVENNMRQ